MVFMRQSAVLCSKQVYYWNFVKRLSSTTAKGSTTKARQTTKDIGNVPGLSASVVSVPTTEVGPGASKQGAYKNPEYFSYNEMSYFQAEVEMLKYRVPQPSNKKKLNN